MQKTRKLPPAAAFLLLTVLLAALLLLNAVVGSTNISPAEVLRVLLSDGGSDVARGIVLQIRLPRLLAAALLGGALSVSGFLLQTFFANPIAGPYVLGISSGAKLAVALAMIASLRSGSAITSAAMVLAAFAGSMLSTGAILLISGRVRNMALLVICGVMIGYICSAITDIVVTFADDSNIVNLHNWSMGSFSGISWGNLRASAVTVSAAMAVTFLLVKPMNAYQMGETYARSVGVDTRHFRVALILLSSVLSACVTAFAGPISFVGIAVPHLMKRLFRSAKPVILVPACFLGGGVFCLLCDLIARTVFAPSELAIGTVTAVFGAPVVIAAMLGRRRKED